MGKKAMDDDADKLERLKESKRKLENRFGVRISSPAFDIAVHGLRTFYGGSYGKSVEIMARSCKLVLESFKNCEYEKSFHKNAYRLRWALVEIGDLNSKTDMETKLWVDRLRQERDRTSVSMGKFLSEWASILESPPRGPGVFFFSEYAQKLSSLRKNTSWNCHSIARFLNGFREELFYTFESLLTVNEYHVAQVVSSLTDVPPTVILAYTGFHKQRAINMMLQGLVEKKSEIYEIYETLDSSRADSTKPRASFLILGPRGSGKTEIARAVAEHWYCDASRLVEIDISDYAEDSTERLMKFWGRLTGVVKRRPYSVIVIDKIEKAPPSIMRVLLELLRGEAETSDVVDFSNSIIFITSRVGSNQPGLQCLCYRQNQDLWNTYIRNPRIFHMMHNCVLKDSGPERVEVEARKSLGNDLLDSVNSVFVFWGSPNYKIILRLLLRKIVSEVFPDKRLVLHASEEVLTFLSREAGHKFGGCDGKGFEKAVHELIVPWLGAVYDLKEDVVVRVDKFEGESELLFCFEEQKSCADDGYFKFKDGTFDEAVANVRNKVESSHRIFNGIRECNHVLHSGEGKARLSPLLEDTCNEFISWFLLQ